MRRSSKAGQLINNSANDDTYKFRCMEYLNFVLDQIVNSNNKFKIYPSHIEVKSVFRKEYSEEQSQRYHDPGHRKNQTHARLRRKNENLNPIDG